MSYRRSELPPLRYPLSWSFVVVLGLLGCVAAYLHGVDRWTLPIMVVTTVGAFIGWVLNFVAMNSWRWR